MQPFGPARERHIENDAHTPILRTLLRCFVETLREQREHKMSGGPGQEPWRKIAPSLIAAGLPLPFLPPAAPISMIPIRGRVDTGTPTLWRKANA